MAFLSPQFSPLPLALAAGLLLSACTLQPVQESNERLARLEQQTTTLQELLTAEAAASRQAAEAQRSAQQEELQALEERLLAGLAEQQQQFEQGLTTITQQLRRQSLAASTRKPAPSSAPQAAPASPAANSKIVIGELEAVRLQAAATRYPARIDTGAETSSLHAEDIVLFERDGKRWVRFKIPAKDDGEQQLERPVVRMVRILQSSSAEADRRPVVELQISIGEHSQRAEFTLTNRKHLEYDLLVGRNILKDIFMVDVSRQFTLEAAPTRP